MTAKRRRFCEEYLIDLNGTQAAIRAGYAVSGASEEGSRLLANAEVAAEIERLKALRSRRTGITADRVLQELARIGFVNPADVIDPEEGTIRPDATVDDLGAVASVKVKTIPTMNGEGVEREIKLHDKVKALELMGKHLGIFSDNLNVRGAVPIVISGGEALED